MFIFAAKRHELMHKATKIFIRSFSALAIALATSMLCVFLALNVPCINSWMSKQISAVASAATGLTVKIQSVRYRPFSTLELEGVGLFDDAGNAVVHVGNSSVDLGLRALVGQRLVVNRLVIDSLYCALNQDVNGKIGIANVSIGQDTISASDVKKLDFEIEHVDVTNSKISLQTYENGEYVVERINLKISKISQLGDIFSARLDSATFSDATNHRDGLAQGKIVVNADTIKLRELRAEYGRSTILVDSASASTACLSLTLRQLCVSQDELSLLLGRPWTMSDVTMSGQMRVDSARCTLSNFALHTKGQTHIEANAVIDGYTDSYATFLDVELLSARTSFDELAQIAGMEMTDEDVTLFRELGVVAMSGVARGSLDDIGLKVNIDSEAGKALIDMQIAVADSVALSGNVSSENFDLTKFTGELIGRGDFDAKVDAKFVEGNVEMAEIFGKGKQIEVLGYAYKNVSSHYRLERNATIGALEIDDEMGHVVFGCGVDFSGDEVEIFALATIDSLRVGHTNITPTMPEANFAGTIRTRFKMRNLDDASGYLRMENVHFSDGDKRVDVDSLVLTVQATDEKKSILLSSDFVNGWLRGDFKYVDLGNEIRYQIQLAADALVPDKIAVEPSVYADFHIEYADLKRFTQFLSDDIVFSDLGEITGQINSDSHTADVDFLIGDVAYGESKIENFNINFRSEDSSIALDVDIEKLTLAAIGEFGTIEMRHVLQANELAASVSWRDYVNEDFYGAINHKTTFSRRFEGLFSRTEFDHADMYFRGTNWTLHESAVEIGNRLLAFERLRLTGDDRSILFDGRASENPADTLNIGVSRLRLENLVHETPYSKVALAGVFSTQLKINDLYNNLSINCGATIDDFYVNHDYLDHLDLSASWSIENEQLDLDLSIMEREKCRARGIGRLEKADNFFDLKFDIDSLSDGFLNYYLGGAVRDIKGTAGGWLRIHGPLPDVAVDAHLGVNRTSFAIRKTNVDYVFDCNDTIVISPTSIDFCNIRFSDKYGKQGTFFGNIDHDGFSNLRLNTKFQMNEQLVYDMSSAESPTYFGSLFATGLLHVTGSTTKTHLRIDAKTCPQSNFFILPLEHSNLEENAYIRFATAQQQVVDDELEIEDMLSEVTAAISIGIEPEAVINVVVDTQSGNMMSVSGSGNLDLEIDRSGELYIQGMYTITDGTYNFSFENVVNKRFQINSGSTITWDGGDPYSALLDIDATYKLKASLYDLVSGTSEATNTDLKRRVPINCNLLLTERLYDPNIRFRIEIPSSMSFSQYAFDQYVSTDEEMNRQAFSLLLAGRFYAVETNSNASTASTSSYVGTTVSELLSNQLSNWISQNKYNLGLGVNYRPGDEVTNEEYEVSFSTQLFDNNLMLSGNVGYGREAGNTSQGSMIGDFDVEYKLTDRGNLRAKAYTHSNNDVIYETSPTTQGIGISYNDEFDSVGELFSRYWSMITGKKRKAKKAAEVAEREAENVDNQ